MTKCVVHRPGYGSVFAATRLDSSRADSPSVFLWVMNLEDCALSASSFSCGSFSLDMEATGLAGEDDHRERCRYAAKVLDF